MTTGWWMLVNGNRLAQGDLLRSCRLPAFREVAVPSDGRELEQDIYEVDLIIVTQSCDLENEKVRFVALCPISTLEEFENTNPEFKKKGSWESVRKGRVEGLHLLASPDNPVDNRAALAVDFGHIVSLPIEYLSEHAGTLGNRWRLSSPFLEHFSQALARFFMRVGLPSSIAAYK